MEAGSSSRMQAALRVLWAHCKLGETVTPEDVENVRWWAGDKNGVARSLAPSRRQQACEWCQPVAANAGSNYVVLADQHPFALCSLRVQILPRAQQELRRHGFPQIKTADK
jgi:hypothetical protein